MTSTMPCSTEQKMMLRNALARRPAIKREKTSLGWAHRIYIGGKQMGTAFTQASARKSVPRMLKSYERTMRRKSPPASA